MTLFHTCCETSHRSGGRGGRMKVNERRTVVGGVDWPLCVPPNRGERSTRMPTPNLWRAWSTTGTGGPVAGDLLTRRSGREFDLITVCTRHSTESHRLNTHRVTQLLVADGTPPAGRRRNDPHTVRTHSAQPSRNQRRPARSNVITRIPASAGFTYLGALG